MERNNMLQAAQLINSAKCIIIAAGAGMGIDSGLPDFRGNKGFWRCYPELESEQLSFSDIASGTAFIEHPNKAWQFYGHRYSLYKNTNPHHGFKILLNWISDLNKDYYVYTTNVDGHFQKAGFDADKIMEVHGSINYWQCSLACNDSLLEVDEPHYDFSTLPQCPCCQRYLRPNIKMFNDPYWLSQRTFAQKSGYRRLLMRYQADEIVVIEIGAGQHIPTIRREVEVLGSPVIRINPELGPLPRGYIAIEQGALEALCAIDSALSLPKENKPCLC
ncbi:SIR2 family NAD-dependent protein deacylase [Motilimonas sp. KMU-193]|uniref:SIR2 family NAD-dependent protein deacylase n=1 Tax=Motilimonas sp. KMU-193 TaxID=3388668 RepID=UPI00396B0044